MHCNQDKYLTPWEHPCPVKMTTEHKRLVIMQHRRVKLRKLNRADIPQPYLVDFTLTSQARKLPPGSFGLYVILLYCLLCVHCYLLQQLGHVLTRELYIIEPQTRMKALCFLLDFATQGSKLGVVKVRQRKMISVRKLYLTLLAATPP